MRIPVVRFHDPVRAYQGTRRLLAQFEQQLARDPGDRNLQGLARTARAQLEEARRQCIALGQPVE